MVYNLIQSCPSPENEWVQIADESMIEFTDPLPQLLLYTHGYKSRVARLCLYRLTADGGCIMRRMRAYFNWNKSDTLNLNSFCNVILDIMFGCCLYLCRIISKTGLQTATNMPFHQDIIMCMSHDEKNYSYEAVLFHESVNLYLRIWIRLAWWIIQRSLSESFLYYVRFLKKLLLWANLTILMSHSKSFMKQLLVSGLNQTCFVNHYRCNLWTTSHLLVKSDSD